MKSKELNSPEYRLVRAYADTFFSESGKVVMDDLMKKHYHVQSYVAGDINATLKNEGCREVMLGILSNLKQSSHPELFEQALDEHNIE